MKKILSIVLTMLLFSSSAQNISVESFRKLENDLTARTQRVLDKNGEPCALIKVVVTGDGFIFEADALGIVKTEHKTGEYYVYVPYGAKHLTVKHNEQGVLRQYAYPVKIEKLTTYELKLALSKIIVDGNYLKISVNPKNAVIYIDGDKIDNDITPFLHSGTHSYKVVLENYTTQTGTFEISKARKENLSITLERSHGYVNVNYKPDGAQIYIDGKQTDRTPARIYLESGQHSIRIMKDMYVERTETIRVTENCNLNLTGYLQKVATGYVHISSNVNYSTVYIDGKYVGSTGQQYEVGTGSHLIKITHSGYNDIIENVKIKGGETKYIKKELTMTRAQKQENRSDRREGRREERRDKRDDRREERRDNRLYRQTIRYSSKIDYPNRGFRFFLNAGYGAGDCAKFMYDYWLFEANAIIGYQIFPHLFLGCGIGGHYYRNVKYLANTSIESDDKSIGDIKATSTFVNVRCDLMKISIWAPFVDLYYGTIKKDDWNGCYYTIMPGVRFRHISYSLGIKYEEHDISMLDLKGYKNLYENSFNDYTDSWAILIKASVDFGARRLR